MAAAQGPAVELVRRAYAAWAESGDLEVLLLATRRMQVFTDRQAAIAEFT